MAEDTFGKRIPVRTPGHLLIIGFLCTVCNGFMAYKFVPIIIDLMNYWDVKEGMIGILQSASSWMVIVFLLPIGIFQQRVAPKISGFLALALMVIGNAIGLLAGNFYVLIVARILEGLGAITINTLTQNLILNSFGKRRTTGIGILNTGQYVGQAINIVMANVLVSQFGWRVVYGYMFVFELVMTVVWVIFANRSVEISGLHDPNVAFSGDIVSKDISENISGETEKLPVTGRAGSLKRILKNKSLWTLAISMSLYGPCIVSFSNYIPTYLVMRGMEQVKANSLFNIAVACGALSMFLTGFLSDKLGTKRKIAIMSFFLTIGVYFLLLKMPLSMIVLFMILFGLIPRTLSVLSFSSIANITDYPIDIPVANSILQMMSQITNIIGNIIIGFLIQNAGYEHTIFVAMGILAAGGFVWIIQKKVP
ncbi:MFS transporter [Lachnospiraceae bacterium ZAX-1]